MKVWPLGSARVHHSPRLSVTSQGRVSRYKKIKAIDPFSKASAAPKEETTSKDANRPPSKRETAYIPRKMREMMQFKEKLSGKSVAARPSGSAAGGPTGAESSQAPNQRYFQVSGLEHGVSLVRASA